MNYTIINGAVEFGAETILEEINFEIKGKDKIAVVGRNGAGKSTLLKAIINNEMLTEGIGEAKFSIYKEGSPVIGYLKQIEFEDDSVTMIDELLKVYKPIIDLENKIQKLVKQMETDKSEKLAMEYSKAMDRYEFLDGYTYKKEYETIINKFGFSADDKNKKISEFSGGQRTKIAFMKLLLSKPDILLLDEPTNHLDVSTIEWLGGYLKNYPRAVVVSHDRMFLDKIANKVYEIEYGAITKYTGNYSDFERQKKVNYEKQLKDYEYQQAEIKRLMRVVERFRYKASKAKMAQAKLKQIEHMVKIKEPSKYDLTTFRTNFALEKESGRDVLHAKNLEIGYDKPIQNVTFDLYRGQKLGVIGENGIGKSTLLKTIVGSIEKLGGEVEFGHNVEIGYFDQQMALLDSEKTVFDDFATDFPGLTTTEIRSSLAAFMFYGEDVFKKIKDLSGGEKVRVSLCKILNKKPNVLILDEPTNHLDIIGKDTIEKMLTSYKGTIIMVSHDRYLIKNVCDRLLVIEGGRSTLYNYGYNEYLEKTRFNNISSDNEIKIEKKKSADKKVDTFDRNKEIKKIERDIFELEERLSNLNNELLKEDVYMDINKANLIKLEIDIVSKDIEKKTLEWDEITKDM